MTMLVASLHLGPASEISIRALAWRVMLVLTWASAGSGAWFAILQKWMLGAFCPFCITIHITGLLLAVLTTLRALTFFKEEMIENTRTKSPRKPWVVSTYPNGRLSVTIMAFVGLTSAGIMAAGQVCFVPTGMYRAGVAEADAPAIDFYNAPLIGPPDARYVVTLLFDYNCPHCQQLHLLLDEVVHRYSGKLAFVLCPSPLNSKCNPYIPRDVDEFKSSCDLARIALSVWVAKRDAFPEFDRWMFSYESGDRWHPRSVDDARAKAIALVGKMRLETAQLNPWIDQYLRVSIQRYADTLQGGNAVPKLLWGNQWVIAPQSPNLFSLFLCLTAICRNISSSVTSRFGK